MTQTPPLGSPRRSEASSAEETQPREASSARSKRWLVMGGVGLALLGLAYGVGRLQGMLALKQVEERHATERKAWQGDLTGCNAERGLLAARQSLSQVALSLERRNFGVAEGQRRDALLALEQPALNGIQEVPKLAAAVRGLNLGVDPNPGTKRDQVVAVSEELDRLLATRAQAGR